MNVKLKDVVRSFGWGAVAILAGLLPQVGAAYAHGAPADIGFWGNFGRSTTRCQRIISDAASRCIDAVVEIRNECITGALAGNPCDATEETARVDAAKRGAFLAVQRCTMPQLQNLHYLNADDAANDIATICSQLDTAARSAAFGPAMVGGSVAAADDVAHRCLEATGAATKRLLGYAIRTRQRAFDRIAAKNLTRSQKLALVDQGDRKIARARAILRDQVAAACPADAFDGVYERTVETYLERVGQQADCMVERIYVQSKVTCPAAVCGNGMQEPGEECDDGNDFEGDTCRSDCKKNACDAFPTTYDLIQRAIFENRGCTSVGCHDVSNSGGLDLRAGVSYQNLIDVPATSVPGYKRVDPGNKSNSLLWINLAARTLPDQWTAPTGRGMPIGFDPLTTDELEALRLWMEEGGATREASIPRTAQLLNACLPEPRPTKIEPLQPPAPGEGIQMYMPNWTLPPKSESEVCFSSYYDFTGQVPEYALTQGGTHFRYKELDIRQDPLSHHLIVDLYRGTEAPNDPIWGPYTCKGGARAGTACDPLDLTFCGAGSACATDPDPTTIACIGFGPQTGFSTLVTGGLAFAQETTATFKFPPGVYNEIPIKGVTLWNSHAFNLTRYTGTLQGWVNIYFPKPEEQVRKERQIFDVSKIFWSDNFPPFPLPQLQAFQQMESCNIHTFGGPRFTDSPLLPGQTAHLFELSGHTHKHGKRFQILRGRFTCKGGANDSQACSPFNAATCPDGSCTDDGGRDPQSALLYTNLVYNDPVVLRLDPPIVISGSAPEADRSLTYCGVYDNGSMPNVQDVKRWSKSPAAGTLFGIPIGGPCPRAKTRCIGGVHHNAVCHGDNSVCDSTPGAGDGDCDACALTGGFRTEDEMFILFGNYWVE